MFKNSCLSIQNILSFTIDLLKSCIAYFAQIADFLIILTTYTTKEKGTEEREKCSWDGLKEERVVYLDVGPGEPQINLIN